MIYILPDVQKADVNNKKVFLLADLDVPLIKLKAEIGDDIRLRVGLQTIQYLLNNNATVIIGGKLGRPHGSLDPALSLKPVAEWYLQKFNPSTQLRTKFKIEETKIEEFDGWKLSDNLFLLENLRFYPEEEENDSIFTKKLASLADIYVNDAFDLCHRNEASVIGIPSLLPHFAGLRLQEEVKNLEKIIESPKRPFVVVIGGAKVETKLPLIEKILDFADFVLVGGKIAEEKEVLEKVQTDKKGKLVIAESNKSKNDIAKESILEFTKVIQKAGTVLWNGPMGLCNSKFKIQNSKLSEDSEYGTREIVKAIVESNAYKVAGGGDTVEFINRMGVFDKFDFVSMAGGAMLTLISGESLPGLEILMENST